MQVDCHELVYADCRKFIISITLPEHLNNYLLF